MKKTGYIRAFCLMLAVAIMMLTPVSAFAADSVIRIDGRYEGEAALLKWNVWKIGSRAASKLTLDEKFAESGIELEGMTDDEVRKAADDLTKFITDKSIAADYTVDANSEGIAEAAVAEDGIYFLTADERSTDELKYTASPAIVEYVSGETVVVLPKIKVDELPHGDESEPGHGNDSSSEDSADDGNDSRKTGGDGESGNPDSGTDSKPDHIPQTGQLWWPVPVLAAAGLVLVALGFRVATRKGSGNDE